MTCSYQRTSALVEAGVSTEPPGWVLTVLSEPRFAPYLAAAGGDVEAAIALEWWNLEVATAFIVPLNRLELALRNALHPAMRTAFRRSDWWASAPLDVNGRRKVADARRALTSSHAADRSDDVVAQLTFGFWISLISGKYHRTLWAPTLHRVFPGVHRKTLHQEFQHVLVLRNRIMHHEPIYHRHLEADHATLYRLLTHLSPAMVTELARRDRVPALLAGRTGTDRAAETR
jgi:hypothetical protein